MNLDLFNNILDNIKGNNVVQNFMKELSNYLEKNNENNIDNENLEVGLRQEECLYQVVEVGTNYAYLQNVNTNLVGKETKIPKAILDQIGEDTVMLYKDGNYIVEDELTR